MSKSGYCILAGLSTHLLSELLRLAVWSFSIPMSFIPSIGVPRRVLTQYVEGWASLGSLKCSPSRVRVPPVLLSLEFLQPEIQSWGSKSEVPKLMLAIAWVDF
jgi:hypothetical protein